MAGWQPLKAEADVASAVHPVHRGVHRLVLLPSRKLAKGETERGRAGGPQETARRWLGSAARRCASGLLSSAISLPFPVLSLTRSTAACPPRFTRSVQGAPAPLLSRVRTIPTKSSFASPRPPIAVRGRHRSPKSSHAGHPSPLCGGMSGGNRGGMESSGFYGGFGQGSQFNQVPLLAAGHAGSGEESTMGGFRIRGGKLVAEYCCFQCKDSGEDLRVCDYTNCLKSYHPKCTLKRSFPPPGEQFICHWHTCVCCRQSSYYHCLCCPNYSVCQSCLRKIKFFKLGKQNKGLCEPCFILVTSIEKNGIDYRVKFYYEDEDSNVSAILFKNYWDDIKKRELLTMADLQEASGLLDRGRSCTHEEDSAIFPDGDNKTDEHSLNDSDDNEQTFHSGFKSKPDKINTSVKRKRSKKKTYLGWGTKELIEFLSYVGKDTKESLDESGVVGVVKEYIQQKGLLLGIKKIFFECDDKLRPLFTRRKMRYNMLHSKLRTHLAVNAATEDESLDDSVDDDGTVMKKKPQASLEPNIAKMVSERNKRCLASLNLNNVKLIYLRRTLVADILKHQDSFEQKVIGCFVRVKNDVRSFIYPKPTRPFQLGLVTGVKKSQEEYKIKDASTDVILCVAGFRGDVKITMLSEDNIQEEECNELIPLVEKGILKRATVAEFEQKVAAVRKDIVNHWINRELNRLEKEIDIANEKGWRKEMVELMNQKKLLSSPAERQHRLESVPEIAADAEDEKETKLKVAAGNSCQVNREATQPVVDSFEVLKENPPKGVSEYASESFEVLKEKPPEGATEQVVNAFDVQNEETSKGVADQVVDSLRVREEESPEGLSLGATKKVAHSYSLDLNEEQSKVAPMHGDSAHEVASGDGNKTEAIDIYKDESNHKKCRKNNNIPAHEVINLDSDDEKDVHDPGRQKLHPLGAMNDGVLHKERPDTLSHAALHAHGAMNDFHLEDEDAHAMWTERPRHANMWHYIDPRGGTRGPFLLTQLREWRDDGYFDEGFKVWSSGQTKDQAILLTDALKMFE